MSDQLQPDALSRQLRELPAFRALLRGIESRLFAQAGELAQPALDIGCGDGHFAALAYAHRPLLGIDIDHHKLREALQRDSHRHLLRASADALPLPDSCIATVTANCVLEHIPALERALAEICRVLQPGGRFIFGVPSDHFASMLLGSSALRSIGLGRLGQAYGDWFNRHSKHYHTHPPEHWESRLQRHGLLVEHWEYYLSAAGLRAFDLAHYLSVPRLLSYKLTGRWVTLPVPGVNALYARWLRPHFTAPAPRRGAYIFFHARKPFDGVSAPQVGP